MDDLTTNLQGANLTAYGIIMLIGVVLTLGAGLIYLARYLATKYLNRKVKDG